MLIMLTHDTKYIILLQSEEILHMCNLKFRLFTLENSRFYIPLYVVTLVCTFEITSGYLKVHLKVNCMSELTKQTKHNTTRYEIQSV